MTLDAPHRTLVARDGSAATLHALGGMLAPVTFRARGRADFQPLQIAPWASEPGWTTLDPGLRHLRGTWPCVPFGRVDRPAGLPGAWLPREPGDTWGHGRAMHHRWRWIDDADDGAAHAHLAQSIDLPPLDAPGPGGEPARLEQHVRWDDAVTASPPALAVELAIHARRDGPCPVALHPTLRLDAGRVRLRLPPHAGGRTYPVPAEPDTSRVASDAGVTSLDAVPARHEPTYATSLERIDLTGLPQPVDGEDLLQLFDLQGAVHVDYLDLGWSLAIDWDRHVLPDVMFWISQAGRRYPPWNGRHRAIGIEPVCGPFDLGRVSVPPSDHPAARHLGVALRVGDPTRITLRLAAQPLP
jgi:hypothetical protein